jgi:hypothetical protein
MTCASTRATRWEAAMHKLTHHPGEETPAPVNRHPDPRRLLWDLHSMPTHPCRARSCCCSWPARTFADHACGQLLTAARNGERPCGDRRRRSTVSPPGSATPSVAGGATLCVARLSRPADPDSVHGAAMRLIHGRARRVAAESGHDAPHVPLIGMQGHLSPRRQPQGA